jgi:hypothetical protein
MGLKAAWFESVRGDPDRLNIDEFLAFRHPEQSHSFLLKIVEDVSNILGMLPHLPLSLFVPLTSFKA